MIIMSVDLGKARTGIAVSDSGESFAFPKEVITEYSTEKLVNKIKLCAEKYSADLIVVGLPKNMDGTEGFRAQECKEIADKINCVLDEISTGLTETERLEFYRMLSVISESLEKVCKTGKNL